jgi:hypothetical protein
MIENKQNLSYLTVPIGLIESAKIIEFGSCPEVLIIKTKDFRTIALRFDETSELNLLFEDILKTVFVDIHDDDIFLTNYTYKYEGYFKEEKESPSKIMAKEIFQNDDNELKLTRAMIDKILGGDKLDKDGWDAYNFEKEFERQGIDSNKFRQATIWKNDKNSTQITISRLIQMKNNTNTHNPGFDYHTYPSKVYVPKAIIDEELAECAIFRTRNRFPALSYFCKDNGASLWRSSQNCTGIMGRKNDTDIRMLQRIGETNENTDGVLIIDARSHISAQANRLKGGGFEQEDYYQNCKLIFGDIDNIHTVRDVYKL